MRTCWSRVICGAIVALFVLAAVARAAAAQQVDVIRGRVRDQQGAALQGARITVTSLTGNVNRSATTDRNGLFTVTFPNGEGDYFVAISSLGFIAKRFEVKRTADQDVLLADATLVRSDPTSLAPVRINAPRNLVARGDTTADIGGTERRIDASTLAAAQMGELAALAASVPGVLYIPGADGDPSGWSVLGLDAGQNNTSLNGLNFGGSDIPRDAQVSASLALAPYDVANGGFSGSQLNLKLRGGTNFTTRGGSLLLDAPQLQWTDPAARQLGQEFTNVSLSGQLGGALVPDHSFYSASYQIGRRANDLRSLVNTDPAGLEAVGISADSVARLRSILNALHIPLSAPGIPGRRDTDQASFTSTLDFTPPSSKSGQAFNLTLLGAYNQNAPASQLSAEVPAHGGERANWNGTVQAHHSAFFGFGILSETAIGLSDSRSYGEPYLALPAGLVRVSSSFNDGTSGVKTVAFGGSQSLNISTQATSADLLNQLSWFSANNQHRLKLTTELRRDDLAADQTTNQLGTFSYNSLADLEAGRAAQYTRQLQARRVSSGQLMGSAALGDSWRVSDDLQLQGGARFDGNLFDGAPEENPLVAQSFGIRNNRVPDRVYVSPRLGFSWTYGTAQQIGAFDGAARVPRAVVRGGIGVFQNMTNPSTISSSLANTGLAHGVQQLNCAALAVPVADWGDWLSDPSSIPSLCATGTAGTPFNSTAPIVRLFAPDFAAPRSLRSNLQWNGPVLGNRFMLQAEVLYSRNQRQYDFTDLNFSPVTRFTLADEGGRPVYAQPSSVDPSTGVIAARDARITTAFDRVFENKSDLSSDSRQFRVGLAPASFSSAWTWNVTYVYQQLREQLSGFSSTAGSPLDPTWGRSGFDSRHQIVYGVGFNLFDAVRFTWNGSIRSGMPYTPMIVGDVNGDGFGNDRAFIFDPAHTADTALGTAMRSLLTSAPSSVRDCLRRQLGRLADRNSCEGPWTSSAVLGISFNPIKFGMSQRAVLSLQLANPLGAADLIAHGEANVHGWGQPATPDAALLYVRGFDPASQRFLYDVNQRFGSTAPKANAIRAPVTLTAMVRFDIARTREHQLLSQNLDRGRKWPGTKVGEGYLKLVYGSGGGLVNPVTMIMRQADSLHLNGPQSDTLALLNRRYTLQLDSIWSPAAKYFAQLPDRYDEGDVYERYLSARRRSVDLLASLAPKLNALLTAEQHRKLPPLVAAYLDTRYLASIRSGTAGQGGSPFSAGAAPPPGGGGGAVAAVGRVP